MPAKRKPKNQNANASRARENPQADVRRFLCSGLRFYIFCGHKKCVRERACAGDVKDCFNRLWPFVPEDLKITIRTTIKARQAKLSSDETAVEIDRQLALWRRTMAPQEADEAAEPTSYASSPHARAPGPRVRVL